MLNQSLWIRRFEVTCPEKRRRRRGGAEMGVFDGGSEATGRMGYPGIYWVSLLFTSEEYIIDDY